MRLLTAVCIVAVLALWGATSAASAVHLPFPDVAFQDSSTAKEATTNTRHLQYWALRKAVVYKPTSLQDALKLQHPGVAVLVVGTNAPQRLSPDEPLLTFSQQAAHHVPFPVQQLLVQCMQQLRPGSRFGLQLDVLPVRQQGSSAGSGPLVVFDASTGKVLLNPSVLQALQSTPVYVVSGAVQATLAAARQLLKLAGQAMPGNPSQLLHLAPQAAAAGIAAAFVTTVPRWFCFVCPIVLGLLSPLVINAGVGEAADLACKTMQLPDDECVNLWFTALALGMILSLLSAIPIYKVCRLYECAHPGPNSTAIAAKA